MVARRQLAGDLDVSVAISITVTIAICVTIPVSIPVSIAITFALLYFGKVKLNLMSLGGIDCIIVGADRVAANGDVANKIGTYSVAVLAKEHNIPFYVAAPLSTIDMNLKDGSEIPIEQRDVREVSHINGTQLAPDGIGIFNPAFDVTPARLITAIITERGIARGDYPSRLKELTGKGA